MEHQENWKPILGFEGLYEVSDLGRVKSCARVIVKSNGKIQTFKEKILKLRLSGFGYLQVTLFNKCEKSYYTIHKLVWESFNGKTNLRVDHIIEGNKLDNRLINLQILTNRENISKYLLTTKKSSKYIGVCYEKSRNKWLSSIGVNGKRKNLGRFNTELDAHNAYQNYLQNVLRTS